MTTFSLKETVGVIEGDNEGSVADGDGDEMKVSGVGWGDDVTMVLEGEAMGLKDKGALISKFSCGDTEVTLVTSYFVTMGFDVTIGVTMSLRDISGDIEEFFGPS